MSNLVYFYGVMHSGRYGMHEQDNVQYHIDKDELIELLNQHEALLENNASNNTLDNFFNDLDELLYALIFSAEINEGIKFTAKDRIKSLIHNKPQSYYQEDFEFAVAFSKQQAVNTFVGFDPDANW